MKKTALYILLFAYSILMLKPLSPIISDSIAHVFFYARHMATVHYEHGKFHVHRDIVAEAKKEAGSKESPSSKKEDTTGEHLVLLQRHTIHGDDNRTSYPVIPSPLPEQSNRADYPPPETC